ncbi:MFS transporter [Tessaracoccus sp. OS52]|uniref:MFS transporter n=1 Tax=Tessaracoccus sp. OS52 TaxID=2886691 RepID=UPI001D1115BF|nr:MFS transporter [Tessaracoccus sp. OS52]MCC2592516.1 MFS transporter [Tessaracoccus sp. OS52]
MINTLRNATYRKLFSAQVIALLGTGLLTVALGLLAFDIAQDDAGAVMGLAMTIKMVAYVGVAPLVSAVLARVPRKPLLITADLVRAAVALSLPFVSQPWQIHLLIFFLQAASATFTPAFQALIPSVLPGEREYTLALSLSRLAYDMEALVSPMIAAALLAVIGYQNLFVGTVVGFIGSASLVAVSRLPNIEPPPASPFLQRLTSGARQFWTNLELRGLLGLNLVVATTTAMVIVNSVVVVRTHLGLGQTDLAILLAANGAGSMIVALTMPPLLDRLPDRGVMLVGAAALPIGLAAVAGMLAWTDAGSAWPLLLALWFIIGAATSATLTPSARILQRNSTERSRPAVYAAQFSLSHACFLITYPLAGTLGAVLGLAPTAAILVVLGGAGLLLARVAWRGAPLSKSAELPSGRR